MCSLHGPQSETLRVSEQVLNELVDLVHGAQDGGFFPWVVEEVAEKLYAAGGLTPLVAVEKAKEWIIDHGEAHITYDVEQSKKTQVWDPVWTFFECARLEEFREEEQQYSYVAVSLGKDRSDSEGLVSGRLQSVSDRDDLEQRIDRTGLRIRTPPGAESSAESCAQLETIKDTAGEDPRHTSLTRAIELSDMDRDGESKSGPQDPSRVSHARKESSDIVI